VATIAVIAVTVTPSPIIARDCTPAICSPGYKFLIECTVRVEESAGLGGNVDLVNVTLRNATTGIEINTVNYGSAEISQRAGSNHVASRGSISFGLGEQYFLALGGRQATMTLTLQFTDDRGNKINKIVTVQVA